MDKTKKKMENNIHVSNLILSPLYPMGSLFFNYSNTLRLMRLTHYLTVDIK